MTTPTPRVVIFDFGGVLVDWNPRYLYRTLIPDPATMERFLAEVCTPEWNVRQDAGRTIAEATAELIARFPEHAELIRAYYDRFLDTLSGAIDGSVAILGELKRAGHTLLGLTNWSHETFPLARARFEFFSWFDGIVVSGEERLIKPDPQLFHRLLDRYRVAPANATFIDDNPPNVAAARALGIHAIHFQSPEQLRRELVAVGLLA